MPRVLIVDDSQPNAELLEAHLDGSGFDTRIASNGEDALVAAREWQPDVILLDVMMPRLSGFEVCERLRADPATHGVGVLMVTALDQPSDVDRAVAVGTDDFITKPINKTELLIRVRALLDARKQATDTDRALAYMGRVQAGV
ncbi:response regulator [bacterium]|nr:response regulator [bacterium]